MGRGEGENGVGWPLFVVCLRAYGSDITIIGRGEDCRGRESGNRGERALFAGVLTVGGRLWHGR